MSLFDSYGLSERCLGVYRALLEAPELAKSSRLPELAKHVGLSPEDLEQDLAKLRELGFLVPNWANLAEYPIDPAVAFGLLTAQRQNEIDALSHQLRAEQLRAGAFISDYGNFLTERSAGDVEIFEGLERANQRMQRFQPAKSIWGLLVASSVLRSDFENSPDRAHLDRGVEIRYIYSESFFKKAGAADFMHRLIEFGGKVRIAPAVPFRLIIFDSEAAAMGIDPDDSSVGAAVHHSNAVVRLATELFQQFWFTARDPFDTPVEQHGIGAQESELLKLFVQGATDEQVARRLGVSMRTVRRIAAKLSEQVGASGRFELGVRAAQRGWVD